MVVVKLLNVLFDQYCSDFSIVTNILVVLPNKTVNEWQSYLHICQYVIRSYDICSCTTFRNGPASEFNPERSTYLSIARILHHSTHSGSCHRFDFGQEAVLRRLQMHTSRWWGWFWEVQWWLCRLLHIRGCQQWCLCLRKWSNLCHSSISTISTKLLGVILHLEKNL